MFNIEKYDNIKEVIPKLQVVLVGAIQSEFLEIKKVNRECEKFILICLKIKELEDAAYVIFSHHIKKHEHKYETFVFIDGQGNIIRYVTGKEMELYGLLGTCTNLHLSDEYIEAQMH